MAHSWYFQVSPQTFSPFPEDASNELEVAYQQWQLGQHAPTMILYSGRYQYSIDFQQMTQTNSATLKARGLERRQNADQVVVQLREELAQFRSSEQRAEGQLEEMARKLQQQAATTEKLRRAEENCDGMARRLQEQVLASEEQAAALEAAAMARDPKAEWQFLNHLQKWQPYDPEDTERLTRLFNEWNQAGQPDTDYQLTDRYTINFSTATQTNLRSQGTRSFRLKPGLPGAPLGGPPQADGTLASLPALAEENAELREALADAAAESSAFRDTVDALQDDSRLAGEELGEMGTRLRDATALRQNTEQEHAWERRRDERRMTELEGALREAERRLQGAHAELALAGERGAEQGARIAEMGESRRELQTEADQRLQAVSRELAQAGECEAGQRALIAEMKENRQELRRDLERLQKKSADADKKADALTKLKLEKEAAANANARLAQLKTNFIAVQSSRNSVTHALSQMPELDDAELRRAGAVNELLCDFGKEVLTAGQFGAVAGARLTKEMAALFADLPDEIPCGRDLEEGPDRAFVSTMFMKSLRGHRLRYESEEWCEAPKLKVLKISSLPVPADFMKKYLKNHDVVSKKNLPFLEAMQDAVQPAVSRRPANEYFLFHGCPWPVVEKIAKEGFDWKHRGTNTGAMFGQGIYFAPHASKCDMYAEKNASGTKCMFLARVMLGDSVPRWRKCPDITAVRPTYDSVCAMTRELRGSVDFPEAVVFEKYQALPLFKIEYVHTEECKCNLCSRGE